MEPTLSGPGSAPEHSPAPSPQAYEALLLQCRRLEKLLIFALVAMVVIVVAMNFFLSRDARAAAIQARQIEARYHAYNRLESYMGNFLSSMQTYANHDTNFMPIWQKYRPILTNFYPVVPDASNKPAGKAHAPAPAKPKK